MGSRGHDWYDGDALRPAGGENGLNTVVHETVCPEDDEDSWKLEAEIGSVDDGNFGEVQRPEVRYQALNRGRELSRTVILLGCDNSDLVHGRHGSDGSVRTPHQWNVRSLHQPRNSNPCPVHIGPDQLRL